MLGLLLILAAIVYGVVLIAVTDKAYRWGLRKWGKPKAYLAGLCGFLLIYLPVFWDHIPTLVAHRYYCAREAGFTVYKTLDQWQKENPETIGILKSKNDERGGGESGGRQEYILNQRFVWIINYQTIFGSLKKIDESVEDRRTKEVIARAVDFAAGSKNAISIGADRLQDYKVWIADPSCEKNFMESPRAKMTQFIKAVKKLGG